MERENFFFIGFHFGNYFQLHLANYLVTKRVYPLQYMGYKDELVDEGLRKGS